MRPVYREGWLGTPSMKVLLCVLLVCVAQFLIFRCSDQLDHGREELCKMHSHLRWGDECTAAFQCMSLSKQKYVSIRFQHPAVLWNACMRTCVLCLVSVLVCLLVCASVCVLLRLCLSLLYVCVCVCVSACLFLVCAW